MKIYAGNLSYNTKDEDLKQAFEQFGQVESAVVVTDKIDGRSKGFGFVEMSNNDEAMTAIKEMNGQELNGRALKVNESRPKPEGEGSRGGFGGGSRGGFGGGGNRGGQSGNRGGYSNSRGGSRGDR